MFRVLWIGVVAGDITKTERHIMPKDTILLSTRLPEGEKGGLDKQTTSA